MNRRRAMDTANTNKRRRNCGTGITCARVFSFESGKWYIILYVPSRCVIIFVSNRPRGGFVIQTRIPGYTIMLCSAADGYNQWSRLARVCVSVYLCIRSRKRSCVCECKSSFKYTSECVCVRMLVQVFVQFHASVCTQVRGCVCLCGYDFVYNWNATGTRTQYHTVFSTVHIIIIIIMPTRLMRRAGHIAW